MESSIAEFLSRQPACERLPMQAFSFWYWMHPPTKVMVQCTQLASTLAVARKQATSQEILLWMTPSEAPKAFQASECSELLDPMRASCWISAQH